VRSRRRGSAIHKTAFISALGGDPAWTIAVNKLDAPRSLTSERGPRGSKRDLSASAPEARLHAALRVAGASHLICPGAHDIHRFGRHH